MLWIYLIVLLILLFGGLLFFFQYILTRNISRATGRLHDLSKDYAAKEKEASQKLQNAQQEVKDLLSKGTQEAQETKEKLIAEAQAQKEQILKEANQKGAEITEKAQRNTDFLRKELENKINERAKEMVNELLQKSVPENFLENIHQQWVNEVDKGALNFKHLKLPKKIDEVKIVSAFPLTDQQQTDLKKKLKEKAKTDIVLKVTVDSMLMAGLVVMIGSVVVDASLRYKIQKAMQE